MQQLWLRVGIILTLVILLALGCSKSTEPVPQEVAVTNSCVDCHTSDASLIATATVDTTGGEGDPGEG